MLDQSGELSDLDISGSENQIPGNNEGNKKQMELIPAVAVVIFAGMIRGYSGFGFAVIAAICLSFIFPPLTAINIALLLDIVSSLPLLKGVKAHLSNQLIIPLSLGMLAAVPFSLLFVSSISAQTLKTMIALMSLVAATMLAFNLRLSWLNQRFAFIAGAVSGFSMTAASSGGPPMALYLMNLDITPAQRRATAIVFFILCSSLSVSGFLYMQILNSQIICDSLFLLPFAIAGNLAGKKLYLRFPHLPASISTAPVLTGLALLMLFTN